jgi:tRNA threonylcarbamoyladenosine biosynthesis protein TsaE
VIAEFNTMSAEGTEEAGRLLGPLLEPGDVLALTGDLGAGKTHLVQGIAEALGVEERVTSPTFNLLLVHPGPLPLYHFDLYRLERESDLEDIDFYATVEGDGVSAIEWGDRFPASLPPDHVRVYIHRMGESARRFALEGTGPRGASLVDAWMTALREQGIAQ